MMAQMRASRPAGVAAVRAGVRWGCRLAVCLAGVAAVVSAQAPALPDAEAFLRATRVNLERSRGEARTFGYTERRTQLHMNPFGRMGSGGTQAFRVTPSADGTVVERRLVERDGVAVTDGEVSRREVRRGRQAPRGPSPYDEALSMLSFTLHRREQVGGRSMIVVRFVPRPRTAPKSREARLVSAFQGEAWVDEAHHEIVRVEAEAVESLSYGFGLVAKLSKGTRAMAQRAEVLPGTWQPTAVRIAGDGRALLFRRLRLDHAIEWYDYRRVGVPGPS